MCGNRVSEMRSLSEMERYMECIAYSRRVRVQTKEKGNANGLRKEVEWNEMVFCIYCLCTHITVMVKMLHIHSSFDHTNTQTVTNVI